MRSTVAVALLALAAGVAATVLAVRNPWNWPWATGLSNRLRGAQTASPAQQAAMNMRGEGTKEAGVGVSAAFIQQFGVRTAAVERGPIPVHIRTVGTLAYDSKKIVSVSTKFEGWIENAQLIYIGQPVREGQPLFEIYSPELVATQQEFLIAADYVDRIAPAAYPPAREHATSLLAAAEKRLEYWDISRDQIQELRRTHKIRRTMQVVSPASGILTAKASEALQGLRVEPGMSIYKIADLSTIWARIQIYEYQARYAHVGQPVSITIEAFPGRRWGGRIVYIDPTVNPQTRTLTVNVEIQNPASHLRPDMFADVEIHVPAAVGLRVPDEAILHTGERAVVVVRRPDGLFDPRQIETGMSGGGFTQVRSGLSPGETIVTSAQFLIDSESNLQEAMGAMMPGMNMGPSSSGKGPAPPAQAPSSQGAMPGMNMPQGRSGEAAPPSPPKPASPGAMPGMNMEPQPQQRKPAMPKKP